MTFYFDSTSRSWAVDLDQDPQPPIRSRMPALAVLIVSAGSAAATLALLLLGA